MSTLYWGLEFTKVALCYIFILFIWPSVIFRKYLRNKSKMFRFCFCATTQVVLINTAVLMLGLGFLLNAWTVNILFYGSLLISVGKPLLHSSSLRSNLRKLISGTMSLKGFIATYWSQFTYRLSNLCKELWRQVRPRFLEFAVLSAIVIYGVIYFGYSPFVNHSYGFGDLYTHHTWIYGLIEKQIFSAGVYPEGLHCIVYLMHTVAGLSVFSCNLFLGSIHIVVYLLSAYFLMREIFHWRYTPLLVLTAFLVVAVNGYDMITSMARLQRSLPGEYGLYTVFLCALFLLRFLKENVQIQQDGWRAWLKNENLLVFSMALGASIAIHFYVTIIAFFVCLPFAIVFIRRTFSKARFQSLMASVVCGVMIAVLPMGGALLSGIPFQGSIGWAMQIMSGEKTEADMSELEEFESEATEDESSEAESSEAESSETESSEAEPTETESPAAEQPPQETVEPSFSLRMASLWKTIKQKAEYLYIFGYCRLIGDTGGTWIMYISLMLIAFGFVFRLICMLFRPLREAADVFDNYLPIIVASLFMLILYAAPFLRIPELISYNRVPSTAYILLLIVAAMPVDILFGAFKRFIPNWTQQSVSTACVTAICAVTLVTGHYHGYFYNELTQYRSAVNVTNSIIQSFPQNTYTIVSTTDELYSVIQYGRHEELLDFLKLAELEPGYYLPTEYIFIYVEKKPIVHAQYHYSSGPAWLATDIYADSNIVYASKYPEIFASQITEDDAKWDVSIYPTSYASYRNSYIRTIVNAKANKWCQDFADLYDHEMKIYYEDDDFICYYFRQNTYSLYDLAIWS